jgi:hypothetical protein
MTRRDWFIASGAVTGSAVTAGGLLKRPYSRDVRPKHSRVAILHADSYSALVGAAAENKIARHQEEGEGQD